MFPGSSFELNTEMSQILAAFNAETVVEKTLRLMSLSKIYEEQFAYRYNLRSVTVGGRLRRGRPTSNGSTRTIWTTSIATITGSGSTA